MNFKNFAVLAALAVVFGTTNTALARSKGPWFPPAPQPTQPGSNRDLPTCLDQRNQPLAVNNDEVVRWKTGTKNQFKDRALITGRFVTFLVNKTSHLHFDVELDSSSIDRNDRYSNHLEVVYNREFGDVTENLKPGDPVAACGDYITATAQAGRYPPSPVGAIIHWVHKSNNTRKHADGFLIINGHMYGDKGDALKGGGRDFNESAFDGLRVMADYATGNL